MNYVSNIPKHVAIIMDGNSRWARANGLPLISGHKSGVDNAKNTVDSAVRLGIKYLSLYAFSTENWDRPQEEVSWLLELLKYYLFSEKENLKKKNIKLEVIGDLSNLSSSLRKQIEDVVRDTSKNDGLCLYIAFSYGGRQEIVAACKKIVAQKIKEDEITYENFSNFLYSKNMPDVDIMIRTAGDMRISNFLLWQSSYAELFFFDKYWPDFNEESFVSVIESYQDRKRTFGIRK